MRLLVTIGAILMSLLFEAYLKIVGYKPCGKFNVLRKFDILCLLFLIYLLSIFMSWSLLILWNSVSYLPIVFPFCNKSVIYFHIFIGRNKVHISAIFRQFYWSHSYIDHRFFLLMIVFIRQILFCYFSME